MDSPLLPTPSDASLIEQRIIAAEMGLCLAIHSDGRVGVCAVLVIEIAG